MAISHLGLSLWYHLSQLCWWQSGDDSFVLFPLIFWVDSHHYTYRSVFLLISNSFGWRAGNCLTPSDILVKRFHIFTTVWAQWGYKSLYCIICQIFDLWLISYVNSRISYTTKQPLYLIPQLCVTLWANIPQSFHSWSRWRFVLNLYIQLKFIFGMFHKERNMQSSKIKVVKKIMFFQCKDKKTQLFSSQRISVSLKVQQIDR